MTTQEVSNPHYIKTSLADNNVGANKEESSKLNNTQSHQIDWNGRESQGMISDEADSRENYSIIICNQGKTIDHSQSPQYAAVNRGKNSLKSENRLQITTVTDDEWFSPGYDEVGGHETASKTVIIIKEKQNPLAHIEPQKRSPSPVYAEVHKDKKKKKQQEDDSVVTEGERSQSPEYSKVEINKHSKEIIVNHENQEDEQHYYHSLENPEEHGYCCENNIGETVCTSEDSQKSQVITTQSMLCETPDPDANTHTETTEVNTFPNPCYHTKMLAAD